MLAEQSSAATDGEYRYRLSRWWGDGPRLTWVMLNPSTADATTDDPTIRRVRTFTHREGFDGFEVINLYALRATNPGELMGHTDPVGRYGDIILHWTVTIADKLVVAWGAHQMARNRSELIRRTRPDAVCLGHTKAGAPRHPLYVKADQPFMPAWDA